MRVWVGWGGVDTPMLKLYRFRIKFDYDKLGGVFD